MDNHHLFSFPPLKMLVVLHATPAATPTETVRFERLFAKVVVIDFVGELFATVNVVSSRGRTDTRSFDTGVLQWVDVDSHAKGMLRELPSASYGAVVETGAVVGLHGSLVGSVEVVHQTDAVDGIDFHKQCLEDTQQVMGDGLVAHHLALLDVTVEIVMIKGKVTELVEANPCCLWQRLALHAGLHGLGDGLREKDIAFITQGVVGMGNVGRSRFFNRDCPWDLGV